LCHNARGGAQLFASKAFFSFPWPHGAADLGFLCPRSVPALLHVPVRPFCRLNRAGELYSPEITPSGAAIA